MPFGNYRGHTIESVYKTDPSYLLWARENLRGDIQKHIADFIHAKNLEIIGKSSKPSKV